METLAPIQQMLWFVQNQRLDNLKLLNNLIFLIRSDADDVTNFKWYPGAQWLVDDPEQVKELPIDPTPANISMDAEALLKGDLQNLMGGMPYASGAQSTQVDQKTATGIQIITDIATRVIETRKLAYQDAFVKMGIAFLDLMKQFMVEPRTIALLGKGGATEFIEIDPEKLQGSFDVFYDIQGDSLHRQERRAEAQSLYQMVLQAAPIHAQFASPLNLDAFLEKLLVAFDEPNPKKYMQTKPQAQAQMSPPGGPGQPAGMPGVPPGDPTPGRGCCRPVARWVLRATASPRRRRPGSNQNGALQQMLAAHRASAVSGGARVTSSRGRSRSSAPATTGRRMRGTSGRSGWRCASPRRPSRLGWRGLSGGAEWALKTLGKTRDHRVPRLADAARVGRVLDRQLSPGSREVTR